MTAALHTSSRSRNKWTGANWAFACVAVALHLILLMLPLRKDIQAPRPGVIELEFLLPNEQTVATTARPVPVEPEAPPQSPELPMATPKPRVISPVPEPGAEPAREEISAAVLSAQIEAIAIPRTTAPSRKLGVHATVPLPGHWTRPLLPVFSGPFEEMFAPAETEVIDQWQDADGTRRVVLRTPGGHTLCGRLEAWNPLNPLYEPVPMYHLCAGGGRRKGR